MPIIGRLERSPASLRWLALAAALVMALGTWVLARQPAAAATHTVRAAGFAFSPANLTVAVGDSITWTNGDAESHAVEGGPLASPEIRAGDSWTTTLSTPGTFSYFCRFHTYMTGTITVGASAPTSPPTTAAPPPTTAPPTTAPPATAPPTAAPPTTAPPAAPPTAPPTTAVNAPPATAPPVGTGSAAFQEVPDDPAARTPPAGGAGDSVVDVAPPPTVPPTTAPPGPAPGFQEVPDDFDGRDVPGGGSGVGDSTVADPPPATAPPTTAPPGPAPAFQDVPDDAGGHHPPGEAVATPVVEAPPSTGDPPPAAAPPTSLVAAPVPTDAGTSLGDGTVLAPFDVVDGVKVFHLTMAETTIEVAPGDVRQAYAFNGVVPGPVLRVDEGDRVRIVVDNQLPFPTSTHWHGMILPNDQDGVGGVTQPHIEPGGQYVYEWTAVATGTHWYHAHSSGRHIGKGLYGPLEVVPSSGDIESDRDYRLMIGDTDLGFTLNGRSFPLTPTLPAEVGETVRLRLVNTGDQVHAMHLHGVPFAVVAQDGIARRQPERMDTLTIAPGQTYDLVFSQEYPGSWLVHCHMFVHSHMSEDEHPPGESGMNGMVAVLDVGPGDGSTPVALGDLEALTGDDLHAELVGLAGVASLLYVRRRRLAVPSPPITLKGPPT